MKRKVFILFITLSFFCFSGCAKKDSTLPPATETNMKTEDNEMEPSIFFTQGMQSNDETVPWNYKIDPEKDKIEVEMLEWIEVETGDSIELHQNFLVHRTDLLSFSQSNSSIEFSYLDEEDVEVEKGFEILSDAIVKDENNKRYEWLRPFQE